MSYFEIIIWKLISNQKDIQLLFFDISKDSVA